MATRFVLSIRIRVPGGCAQRKEMSMDKAKRPIVRRSLFSWVFDGNLGWQLSLLAVIAVVVFARVLPLEMQKRIVNQAITLRDLDLLLLYCGFYLAAVLLANACKYAINILETLISQRVLKRMRSALYDHIISLPLSFFRTPSRAPSSTPSPSNWSHRPTLPGPPCPHRWPTFSPCWRLPVTCSG
jgi:ABC-type bacteriocin/lantibiotic exporter with double-glycine peptidase domain